MCLLFFFFLKKSNLYLPFYLNSRFHLFTVLDQGSGSELFRLRVSVPIIAEKGCKKDLKTVKENQTTLQHRSQMSQRRTWEIHIWG